MTPREKTAERLLQSSQRISYDPLTDIDWDAPIDPDVFWLPPKRSSLYGTGLWAGLDHRQQVELTKHEVASAAAGGLWFETILMQMLVRHYYDADPTSQHAQYALTEVADECRHSIMFGRLISKAGTPVYAATRYDHALGRFLKATARGPHMWASILIAEEILDTFQREIMNDGTLQPVIRQVSKIHVVEESRHISYAKDELIRQVQKAGRLEMAYSRLVIARAAYSITNRMVRPQVYTSVGIPASVGHAAARSNPEWQATLRWSARKIVAFLRELDLIGGPGLFLWRKAHLL